MYCSSCSKMVGYDEATFEVEDPEVSVDLVTNDKTETGFTVGVQGTVTTTVTMTLPCAECGEALKQAEFEVEQEFEMDGDSPVELDETIELGASCGDPEERESGGGRYRKNMRGFNMEITVSAPDIWTDSVTVSVGDEIAASQFDDC